MMGDEDKHKPGPSRRKFGGIKAAFKKNSNTERNDTGAEYLHIRKTRPVHVDNTIRGIRKKCIGYRFLEEIAKSAENDIILNVNKKYEAFLNLLNSPIEKPDMFVLIIQILSKVCVTSFERLKIKFLLDVCNSQFITYLRIYLMDLPYITDKKANNNYWLKQDEFWANLILFCETVTCIAPSVAKSKFRSLIEDTSKICLEKLSQNHNFHLPEQLNLNLNELREKLTAVETETVKNTKDFIGGDQGEPPEDFRTLSVLPTRNDLLDVKPFLRPNIINGAYRDVDHYLDIQFRLLREDCFGPLRDGLSQFVKDPSKRKYDNIRIYRNVQFVAPYILNKKIGSIIGVDQATKKKFRDTKWEFNKRFIFGSLLLLTKNNCKSFIAVTVLDRHIQYLSNGMIPVEIMDPEIGDEIYNNKSYVLIESEVYFEPYYHVLKGLQDPAFPRHLSMKKYIVDVDANPTHAKYLDNNTMYTVFVSDMEEDKQFNVLNFDTWPTRKDLNLNMSQYEAFKVALTHEFAVIQGPPGTGKTYLGVKIAKILLQNVNLETGCKIMLVCYTNHALDQFLEALLPFTESIVRIGGQSRNASLENINLNKIRNSYKHREYYYAFNAINMDLKFIFSDLEMIQEIVDSISIGILTLLTIELHVDENDRHLLKKIYTKYKTRTRTDPILLWLFENMNTNFLEPVEQNYEITPNSGEYNDNRRSTKNDELNEHRVGKNNMCFTLPDTEAKISDLVDKYNREKDSSKRSLISREIATNRAKIRLFLEMREYYMRENEVLRDRNVNVTKLSTIDRWFLYFKWSEIVEDRLNRKKILLKKSASEKLKDYEEAKMVIDSKLLANTEVIGMTTSCAARMRKVIQAVAPQIVIVEEAAEVLEQHIITSLTRHCKHLILIGDHKQLRPSAAHMKLARHYNIEVSLFERMIMNNIHNRRLTVQHRMRPEFAELLTPLIYPDLQNDPSVLDFPDVLGIKTNLYFFTHDFKEMVENDSRSKRNPKEADMVLLLANYIMQQGYDAHDVTILAAYSGQMFYMRNERKNYSHLAHVKITLVDNYQGEESKIILLSLVRNNDECKIGFLGTENRICVALSRAREGFYLFGNIDILKEKSTLWNDINKILTKDGNIGTSIELVCQNHSENITTIASAEDFSKVPEGGCTQLCNYTLTCGHSCHLLCHSYDREHTIVKCQQKCERTCDEGHECRQKCWENCNPCTVRLTKKFPCDHANEVYCHMDPNDTQNVHCLTLLDVKLPNCGHNASKPCYMNIQKVICRVPCDHRLDKCGHACARLCHVTNDPDHEKYTCRKYCAKAKKGCSMDSEINLPAHQCNKLCYEDCDECNEQVLKSRTNCRHKDKVACHINVDDIPCNKKCARKLPCDHFCKKKCREPCGDCNEMVNKVIPECQHTVKIKCKLDPIRTMCPEKCERKLPCGHSCSGYCKEECDPKKCMHLTSTELNSPCGHIVTLPCAVYQDFISDGGVRTELLLKYCKTACGATLLCEHECGGDCGSCYQGRLHVPCRLKCRKINVCGHECTEPCSKVCPPCRVKCEVKCTHSRCTKLCGEVCSQCAERCARSCPHGCCKNLCRAPCSRKPCVQRCMRNLACGHRCRGYCGEPCPDICKECRPDDFPKDFLGYDFEDDDIFIVLDDCGHILESEQMESLMNGDSEFVGIRTCPFCRKPITSTQRYKDQINHIFKTEINLVKKKLYGDTQTVTKKREELQKNIAELKPLVTPTFVKVPSLRDSYKALWLSVVRNKNKCDLMQIEVYNICITIMKALIEYCVAYYDSEHENTLEKEVDEQISMICKYLIANLTKLSIQQQNDLNNELLRTNAIVNLSKILGSASYKCNKKSPNIEEAHSNARAAVLNFKIYDNDEGMKALKHFQKSTNSLSITEQERVLIVKAMGFRQGHWFKCPNGHVYCIADCGGAVVVGRCNECGAEIGGNSHRLLSDNRHAPEMDNSRFPAYSEEYNNMGNFHLV